MIMKLLSLLIIFVFLVGCTQSSNVNTGNNEQNSAVSEKSMAEKKGKTEDKPKATPKIEYDIEIKINEEEGISEVEVDRIVKLQTIDKDKIIDEISSIFRLEKDFVNKIIEFDNEEKEISGDTKINVGIEAEEGYSRIELQRKKTFNTIDKEELKEKIKSEFRLSDEVVNFYADFEDD